MEQARDRIIFALDVPDMDTAIGWADRLRDSVGVFKVGLELYTSAGSEVVRRLVADGHRVFLDLKLHDIPATVGRATAVIADMGVFCTTVHCAGGPAMLEAAARKAGGDTLVFGVTVLTSDGGSPIPGRSLGEVVLERAGMAKDAGLAGVICSGLEVGAVKQTAGREFLAITPGIRMPGAAGTDDQSRVATPCSAIRDGADFIVVGRPIRDAEDPVKAAAVIAGDIARGTGVEE
ncbi:MAG: orotidine-5'-phosphate decarboxylase [Desulfatibacillaceae bacterium]